MDIETCPVSAPPDNPELIAAWADQALDPTRGRIACIGICGEGIDRVFMHEDERVLLEEFWAFIDSHAVPPTIVTYNGEFFDLPFLRLRSIVNRLKPHWLSYVTNGANGKDLMRILFPWQTTRRSKDAVCAALGIEQHKGNGLTGADMPMLWHEGQHDKIVEHCRDDVRREWQLYKRIREAGLIS